MPCLTIDWVLIEENETSKEVLQKVMSSCSDACKVKLIMTKALKKTEKVL